MMIVIILVCGIGAWPCGVVVGSETSSLQLRGLTQGVGSFADSASSSIVGIVLPYIFNPDQGDLGGKTGFLFSAACAVAAGTAWACIPEMKERSAAEIDEMFKAGLPARKFEGWRVSSGYALGTQSGSCFSHMAS